MLIGQISRSLRLLAILATMMLWPLTANAALIASGQLSSAGGSISLNNGGAWSPATLDWSVDLTAGVFTYIYTFTVPDDSKEISHLSIQVSDDFGDIVGSCSLVGSSGTGIGDCTGSAAEDPTSPNDEDGSPLFSIKLDNTAGPMGGPEVFAVTYTLTTDVAPVWGDFFAKDGGTLTAFNSGYTFADATCAVNPGNVGGCGFGFLAVPDSNAGDDIPEPSTLLLFGTGLIGLGILSRRRRPVA